MIAKLFGRTKTTPPPKPYGIYSELFSSLPTLRSQRLVLRPIVSEDAPSFFELDSDEEICRLSLSDLLKTPEDADRLVRNYLYISSLGYPTPMVVEIEQTGQFIGTCGVTCGDPSNRTLRLGFCYIRSAWNQGYGTEALQTLIGFLFETTDILRLECHCFPTNMASRRVMEKSGMSFEGVLRQNQSSPYGQLDCCVYSILKTEWQ